MHVHMAITMDCMISFLYFSHFIFAINYPIAGTEAIKIDNIK